VPAGSPSFAGRLDRFGVPLEARGVLVERAGETLLLELEAPVAKLAFVSELYDRWVRELSQNR
jgi:hypothetical protein